MQTFITIKDQNGVFYPLAYIESKERHPFCKHPKLDEGESLVEVQFVELAQ